MKNLSKSAVAVLLALSLTQPVLAEQAKSEAHAKNVILLISDGAGMQTWNAASYYRFGALGKEVYDKFDVKLFASTYPLNTSTTPTKSNDGKVTFDPENLWKDQASTAEFKGKLRTYPNYFTGYQYATSDYTDSAAAATALASGYKTYNNAINWSNDDTRLKHIGEYVVESGRALGVVTSVQWTHATPAGFLAHNNNRNNYQEIAQEIINSGLATVVMGAGHPYYDNDGKASAPKDDKAFRYVGGKESWDKLAVGDTEYRLIERKEDFVDLANNHLDLKGKKKVLGTAQVKETLQFNRAGTSAENRLSTSPDLATMTKGALNVVSQNPNGFFLMVEGGAVDWAAHANNLPRIIEEQIDFNLTVEAVVDWVEKNSSWEETLVIVTTDHGNGLLQGVNSDQKAYAEIINQGAGALPLVRWHTDNHTRELVPVYAKGQGANYFTTIAKDAPSLANYSYTTKEMQRYIDNTNIFDAAAKSLGIKTDKN
ncbi:alkaline phosphatase [Pasteurellaceae bacterium Pebbles2]|nr:alkaline phosphatase [Pasteurellaceae bacterium Pebbles2]